VQQPELILDHMGHVRGIAGWMVKKYGCSDLFPDLCQEGFLALLRAAERFDETLGIQFWAFASKRVWGAMVNGLRRWCWDGYHRFESKEHGKTHIQYISLTDLDICAGDTDLAIVADIRAALAILDDRERYVIVKTYIEGYTLLEIGKGWNLGTEWVCKIRSKGLSKMRAHVEEEVA